MTKVKMLKIVNPLMILSAFIQMVGGILLFFSIIFPFLVEIHAYNGLTLTALIVIHFILNWTWVKNTFFAKKTPQNKAQ